jgi:predicted deacetylase
MEKVYLTKLTLKDREEYVSLMREREAEGERITLTVLKGYKQGYLEF